MACWWCAVAVVCYSKLSWQPWLAAGLWSLPAVAGDARKCVYFGQGSSLALPAKGALGGWLVPRTFCRWWMPSQKETPVGRSLCFTPLLPTVPSPASTGFRRSSSSGQQRLRHIQSHSWGSLSAWCQQAAPSTTFPSFAFKMWFGKRKKGGAKRVTNVICFGGEVTVPTNPFPASSSGAAVAGMAGARVRK